MSTLFDNDIYDTWMKNLRDLIEYNKQEENNMARLDFYTDTAYGFSPISASEQKRQEKLDLQREINSTELELRKMKENLAKLNLPDEPSEGTSIRFVHTYGFSGDYTFVAYRHGDTWHLSGKLDGQSKFKWADLVKKMSKGKFDKMIALSTIMI